MSVPTRRALLIVNPASRRGARAQRQVEAAFRRRGIVCDVACTERPGHGAQLAAERHADYDVVFTLGGDGTAMEVVGALAGTGRPVGILPGGTGNLLARTLGVSLRAGHAVDLLLDGDEANVDLGRLTSARHAAGHRFAFAAGVGVDATMIERTPASWKRRLGVVAYALSATRAVLRRETFVVKATVDGELVERTASAVMVANFGAVLNDLITLGPGIRQDDGALDLCIFSPTSLVGAIRLVWRLVRRDFTSDATMFHRSGHRFRIETIPPRQAQADGELLGDTPFEVEVEARVARLLVPKG